MKTIKKTFPVSGMTCASCANTVEKTLKAQKGIKTAAVNYANASALVEYEEEKANLGNIEKAVSAIGYGIITRSDADPAEIEAMNLRKYRRLYTNTTLAVILAVPLFLIGMFGMHMPYANYIMWGLSTPIVFFFGRQFFTGAFRQLLHFSANMDTLVAISTGLAYFFSVFNTLYPQYWTAQGLDAPVYFEASGVVIAFILLGKLLEERARESTSGAIKKLMGLQPSWVTLINEKGEEEDIEISQVLVGHIVLARPGDKIAVDGSVVYGDSYVNESMITGEPIPVLKEEGSKVYAGTINQKGSFRYKADKVGSSTLLAHIIRKVQEAQGSKAPVQQLADRISGIFVQGVLVIAVLCLVVWLVAGGPQGLSHGLLATITVLVIACPCALGLATPTAIIAGVGKAAEHGILVKDAESLENIHKLNAIVLDKTGTLTEGLPVLVDIAWKDGVDSAVLSSILYSMELRSEHPLAGAITGFFKELHINTVDVSNFSSITGSGVTAIYGFNIYFAGSQKLLTEMNISIPTALQEKADAWGYNGNSVVWLANHADALAAIAVSDKVKTSSASAVAQLQELGIYVYMLTGDNEHTAYAVAKEAGITQYKAGASPQNKQEFIKRLQDEGKIVGMAGDGINDSQALAQANVSIAMGTGSDIAMDVAQMTLISADLKLIARAIAISRKTVRTIHTNLFLAFIYNVVAIPIAAGALYPVNGFLLNPMIAGAAMALSSISVVTNSLRLKWSKIE